MTTPVSSSGSSSAAAAAAARAAALAEARRRAEAAQRAAEAARKAAEAAKKAAAKAALARKAEVAKTRPNPELKAKLVKAEKSAADALQKAEEKVAVAAKKARQAMEEANHAAAQAGAQQPAFAAREVKAAGPTKLEVAAAFDGSRRKADLAQKMGLAQAPSATETQQQLTAQKQLETLQGSPSTRAALDTLGIKSGAQLVELGDRLQRQLERGESSRKTDASLRSVGDAGALQRVLTAAAETRTDPAVQKTLKDPFFAERVQAGDSPRDAQDAAAVKEKLQLSDRETTQLLRNTTSRNAVKALLNPDSTPAQRASGLIATLNSLNQAVPPERMKAVLQGLGGSKDLASRFNTNLGNLKGLTDAYATFTNPDATAVQKARAALGVATSLKGIAGTEVFKDLAPALRKLDGPARLIGAGLTLFDSKAKPEDRALAALTLLGEARGAWKDLKALGPALRDAKIPDPDAIVRDAESLTNRTLANLPTSVTDNLTGPQVAELQRAGTRVDLADLKPLLTRLDATNTAGLDEVLKQVNSAATPDEAKRFLGAVSGLDPKVASTVLQDPASTQRLADLAKAMPKDQTTDHLADALKNAKSPDDVTKLVTALEDAGPDANKVAKTLKGLEPAEMSKLLGNADGLRDFAKTVKALDGEALDSFVKLTKNMDADGIANLAKYASKADGDVFQRLMKGAAPLLEKMDGRAIGELANGLAKGLGAVGSMLSRFGITSITGDIAAKVLKNVAKMVPVLGAIPGFVDAALLTKQSAELRNQNKDLSLLALNGAKLNALDSVGGLILDATGVGVGVDLAVGVGFGVAELALDIGLSQERAKMEAARANGTEYEAPGWVKGVNIAAAALQGPTGVAEYISLMGPKKAFEDAKWALGQGGKLADKAWDLIKAAGGKFAEFAGEAVEALKDLGEFGVDKLEDLASGTGELAQAAAKQAQEALRDVARSTGEAAKKAAQAIGRAVDAGAEWAQAAATELLKDGVEAMHDVARLWSNGMSAGAKAVVDGLEDLGEAGVDALKTLGTFGGDVAEYTVGSLKNLAEDGVDLAKDALGTIADLGGKAGDLAGDVLGGLGGLAKKVIPGW